MSLDEYRRKRRFDKTREPEPGRSPPTGEHPIFVVQLHHASHRHYDFRLQVGDALKSWAVPKGPSLDPAIKRLAAEVEDHPLAYADFEGDIPVGQYGAGHVAIFDSGVWCTEGDVQDQLDKGHLKFQLFGERLRGGWHLVRSRRNPRRPEWLLFKQRDEYAAEDTEADDLLDGIDPVEDSSAQPEPQASKKAAAQEAKNSKSETSAKAQAAASGSKATRAGKTELRKAKSTSAAREKTASRMDARGLPGARAACLQPEAITLQLARLVDQPPEGEQWIHEPKWDGYRILALIENGEVSLWSRNRLEWTHKLPEVVAALRELGLRDAALDGELIAGRGARSDFGLLQATLSGEKRGKLTYMLFDILHLDGIDLSGVALLDRKELLEGILQEAPRALAYSSHLAGSAGEVFKAATEQGLEGIISKRADAPHRDGRSDDWRKSKDLTSDEFAVVGFTPPKGSRAGFGSLLLARPDPQNGWRYCGRLGTGFSNNQLTELLQQLDSNTRSKPTVHVPPHDTNLRDARWIEPTLVVEAFYRGVGKEGLLRQPSLKTVRNDKSVQDLFNSDRTPPSEDIMRLTHPERVVYPDRGTTKGDVAEYYITVMPWLLPEIINRPVSIIRCTQGTDKACFFQKHATAGLSLVDTVPIVEESGMEADYLVVRNPESLMELVQFNALEFHPWGSTADRPDVADRIVFDLDPAPDVPFKAVITAARQIRELLEEVSLTSFVRTSGGKGLHVVVPLNPGCEWSVVKPFARAFAESLAAREPDRYIATASKAQRKGRVFIDYLRNGRGATSVASWSLRSRPGAPVAVPLAWDELGKLKRADAFDIDSTPARLARLKSDPWEEFDRVQQDLSAVREALAEDTAG